MTRARNGGHDAYPGAATQRRSGALALLAVLTACGAAQPSGAESSSAEPPRAHSSAADCYVEAVNDEDLDALVDCFARDAVVVDVSRRIEGRTAIREWAASEVIGGRLRVIEREPRPNGIRLLVHWAPSGSDGWQAHYTFDAAGGGITVAELQYA